MRLPTCFQSLLMCVLLVPSLSFAADGITLTVNDTSAKTLNAATLAGWPRANASAGAHDDAPSVWEGVALIEVLRKAGAPVDQQLRGAALASVVRVTASDGYQVVFTLAELDAAFGNAAVILVDTRDGKPLGAADGPFRLVVPADKRAGRWLRNVVRIEVISVRSTPVSAERAH